MYTLGGSVASGSLHRRLVWEQRVTWSHVCRRADRQLESERSRG